MREKSLLKFAVVGSVDDGKSTLIGRLLLDTNSLFKDQIDSIKNSTYSDKDLNLAFFTDGLKEEREKGITIDIAYRFFESSKKKFIVVDCPGHKEFTKNTITGLSQVENTVILVDASRGIREQTKRHLYICYILGIKNIFVCINKMDSVGYNQGVFENLKEKIEELDFAKDLNLYFIPTSAIDGDNIVKASQNLKWYSGKTLFQSINSINDETTYSSNTCFQVQFSSKIHNKKFLHGYLSSGRLENNMELKSSNSNQLITVKSVNLGKEILKKVSAPISLTIEVECEKEIERGDCLIGNDESFLKSNLLHLKLMWMDVECIKKGNYFLKHLGKVYEIRNLQINDKFSIEHMKWCKQGEVFENDLLDVEITLNEIISYKKFKEVPELGRAIFISSKDNKVKGAGLII